MDTPSATWHPAMMPLYNNDIKQTSEADSVQDEQTVPVDEHATENPIQDAPNHQVIEEGAKPQLPDHGAFLDQFNHDDNGEAAWDISATSPAAASQGEDGFARHAKAYTQWQYW